MLVSRVLTLCAAISIVGAMMSANLGLDDLIQNQDIEVRAEYSVSEAPRPSSIIGNISFEEVPGLNESANLFYVVTLDPYFANHSGSLSGNSNTTLQLPAGVECLSNCSGFQEYLMLSKSVAVLYAWEVQPILVGNWTISAKIEIHNGTWDRLPPDDPRQDDFHFTTDNLTLHVTDSESEVSYWAYQGPPEPPGLNETAYFTFPPDETKGRSAEPSNNGGSAIMGIEDNLLRGEADDPEPLGQTIVEVWLEYYDYQSGVQLAAYQPTFLCEPGTTCTSGDGRISETETNHAGHATFPSISNNGQNVFIAWSTNGYVTEVSGEGGVVYGAATDDFYLPNQPDYDAGWHYVPSDHDFDGFRVYQSAVDAWQFIYSGGHGYNVPKALIKWQLGHDACWFPLAPDCGWSHWHDLPWSEIHLTSEHGWEPAVVMHEFGHHAMFKLYGNWKPPTTGGPHSVFTETSAVDAWVEGFGDFIASARGPRYNHYLADGHWLDMETWMTDAGDLRLRVPQMAGHRYEWTVATSLYDLSDLTDDGLDEYDGHLSEILSVMQSGHQDDFDDFWDDWKTQHPASDDLHFSKAAVFENRIDYNNNPWFLGDLETYSIPGSKRILICAPSIWDIDLEDGAYFEVYFEFWEEITATWVWFDTQPAPPGPDPCVYFDTGLRYDGDFKFAAKPSDGIEVGIREEGSMLYFRNNEKLLSVSGGDNRDPDLFVDSNGYSHIVWESDADGDWDIIYSQRQPNGNAVPGLSYVKVSESDDVGGYDTQFGGVVTAGINPATQNFAVYVFYVDNVFTSCKYVLKGKKYESGAWSNIWPDGGYIVYDGQAPCWDKPIEEPIAVDITDDGTVHLVHVAYNDNGGPIEIEGMQHIKSSDGGATWSQHILVLVNYPQISGWHLLCLAYPQIDFGISQVVHVTYSYDDDPFTLEDSSIMYMRGTANGDVWEQEPVEIGYADYWKSRSTLASHGISIYVAWQKLVLGGGPTEIYMSFNLNNGLGSWSRDILLEFSVPCEDRYSPSLEFSSDGVLHLLWSDVREGGDNHEVYHMKLVDGNWVAESRVTNSPLLSLHSELAFGPDDEAHLVWMDGHYASNFDVYFK